MALSKFEISYPDFQLGEIIQPDEFDVNNREIVGRIGELTDVLNQITDSIGGTGGDIISIAPIAPFIPNKLQAFLEAVVEKLQSSAVGAGSQFIGAVPVTGVSGANIKEQIESLKALCDAIDGSFITEMRRVEGKADDAIGRIVATNHILSDNSSKIATLDENFKKVTGSTVNRVDFYDKLEVDAKVVSAMNKAISNKAEIDSIKSTKTAKTGNHEGTWQGLNTSDLGGVIGVSEVAVSRTRPISPVENMLWYDPLTQQYRIYKDGQFRTNGYAMNIDKIENRVSISTKSSSVSIGISEFNKNFDDVMVFKNSIFIAEGKEYNVSSDSKSIDKISGEWDKDTIFDFIVLTSVPVVSDFTVEDFVQININEDARVVEEGKRVSLYNQIKAEYESGALKGEDGKDGIDGVDGVDGVDGITPVKGVDYFDGEQGIQGEQGPRGEIGPQGPRGEIGLQGPRGETGLQGEVGSIDNLAASNIQSALGFLPKDYVAGHNITINDNVINSEGEEITLESVVQALGYTPLKELDIENKVDKITGKGLSANDFTTTLKNKLDGIDAGANKYTHPDNHSLDMITETTTKKIMTNLEREKLEGVAKNANNYSHPLKHPPAIIDQDLTNRFISDLELAQIEDNKINHSTHVADYANPHNTNKTHVGLSNVDNVKQMPISNGTLENYREKLVALSGASTVINLSLGNVFTHNLTGNTTYTISNAISGQAHSFTLIITQTATVRTLTFPASVKWQGGEIPDLTTGDKTYVLTFVTVDGGTNWYGMYGGEF